MTAAEVKKSSKKRKAEVEEETHDAEAFPKSFGGLEITDEDGDEQDESDGEVDEFPEIDTRSDSEEDEVEDAYGEDAGEDDQDDEDDESGSEVEDAEEEESETDIDDDEINVFPKAKTIVSDITGQPKRVYPEIEPDYDSDSSTEDVRSARSTCYELH